ncbi:helix-turn-helix domain-containing protein [Streptomyces griseofuscus]|uniref:helix-turn-helix domain-containing protein n=1 Tax=Streptomyces griseofuscus TaxID=146922 RepID=UPI001FD01C2E|nr:helix-turn-helix transcriptional regulator [Streptomyces griseofuscus]
MIRRIAGAPGPVGSRSGGDRPGRRGTVRYLKDEAVPSAPRMLLGHALRSRRHHLGLKQEEVARRMGCSSSKLSRIESGMHHFKEKDLLRLFVVYEISGEKEQAVLLELAEIANQPTWWQEWSTVAQPYLQAVISFEDMATRIKAYSSDLLHGLAQTPAYAEALIRRGRGERDTHDALLGLRKERRARFEAAPGKKLIIVVHAAALLNRVGSPEIMADQMEHLAGLSERRNHQLRLVDPAHHYDLPVELGTTTIFDFEGRVPKVAYAENLDGCLFIQDEDLVDHREVVFDELRFKGLGPDAARRKLNDLARMYRKFQAP